MYIVIYMCIYIYLIIKLIVLRCFLIKKKILFIFSMNYFCVYWCSGFVYVVVSYEIMLVIFLEFDLI